VYFDAWKVGQQAAITHWGGNPPCGEPVFERIPDDKWLDTIGLAAPITVEDHPAAAYKDTCRVIYNSTMFRYDPLTLCTIIVHEYGHLWGHAHTQDPKDIMYEGPEQPDWACRRLMKRAPYAEYCKRAPISEPGLRLTDCRTMYAWKLRAPLLNM
jgi:hypothetical protein